MSMSAKITSKGQITLPAELRRQLGVKPGDRLEFKRNKDGDFAIIPKTHTFEDLRGFLKYDGPPLSDEDIVQMVREARAEMGRRVDIPAAHGKS